MIFSLKDYRNYVIAEVEIWIQDSNYVEMGCIVNIENYSQRLVSYNDNRKIQDTFIRDISHISHIRGWMWDVFFMEKENNPSYYDDVQKIVRSILSTIAEKYKLILTQD